MWWKGGLARPVAGLPVRLAGTLARPAAGCQSSCVCVWRQADRPATRDVNWRVPEIEKARELLSYAAKVSLDAEHLDAERIAREQDEAAEPRPGSQEELEELAAQLIDRGLHERAGIEYRRLLLVAGDATTRARARRGLALSLSLQERHDEALHEADALPGRERDAVRAWLLQRAGRMEEALRTAPVDVPEDRLYAGLLALEAGRGPLARQHFATLPESASGLLGQRVDEFLVATSLPARAPAAVSGVVADFAVRNIDCGS